jgi:serine/threonine protein kinase
LELVVAMIEQLGAALQVAHRAGVMHRDLKPANVRLDTVAKAIAAYAPPSHTGVIVTTR